MRLTGSPFATDKRGNCSPAPTCCTETACSRDVFALRRHPETRGRVAIRTATHSLKRLTKLPNQTWNTAQSEDTQPGSNSLASPSVPRTDGLTLNRILECGEVTTTNKGAVCEGRIGEFLRNKTKCFVAQKRRARTAPSPLLEAPVGLLSRMPSSHFQHPKEPAVTSRHKISSTHARTVRVRGDSMRPCTT